MLGSTARRRRKLVPINVGQVDNLRRIGNPPGRVTENCRGRFPIGRRLSTCPTSEKSSRRAKKQKFSSTGFSLCSFPRPARGRCGISVGAIGWRCAYSHPHPRSSRYGAARREPVSPLLPACPPPFLLRLRLLAGPS